MRKGLALGYQSQPLFSTNGVNAARKNAES